MDTDTRTNLLSPLYDGTTVEVVEVSDIKLSNENNRYIDKFTIVDVEKQQLLTSTPINFSTSYDLITVSNPLDSNELSTPVSLEDALIGVYDDTGNWLGHYNVDWGKTSIWHEMTQFQTGTAKRFFGIWGYFKKDHAPAPIRGSIEKDSEGYDWKPLGEQVYTYSDDGFIDPADASTWGGKKTYSAAIATRGVQKYQCGSLLRPEDIRTYYRIPRYKVEAATEDGIANAWKLTSYSKPNQTETEGLLKRVYQSSITETMYDAVRMQEALPVEEYDTEGDTTAIMSSEEIIKLFTTSANLGCANWAASTSTGGGSHTNGPITTIKGRR